MDSTTTHEELLTNQCRVMHGVHEDSFPLASKTVGAVKRCLTTAFSIPYFAEARVGGRPVEVSHALMPGDSLVFAPRRGWKGEKTAHARSSRASRSWTATRSCAVSEKR